MGTRCFILHKTRIRTLRSPKYSGSRKGASAGQTSALHITLTKILLPDCHHCNLTVIMQWSRACSIVTRQPADTACCGPLALSITLELSLQYFTCFHLENWHYKKFCWLKNKRQVQCMGGMNERTPPFSFGFPLFLFWFLFLYFLNGFSP